MPVLRQQHKQDDAVWEGGPETGLCPSTCQAAGRKKQYLEHVF